MPNPQSVETTTANTNADSTYDEPQRKVTMRHVVVSPLAGKSNFVSA